MSRLDRQGVIDIIRQVLPGSDVDEIESRLRQADAARAVSEPTAVLGTEAGCELLAAVARQGDWTREDWTREDWIAEHISHIEKEARALAGHRTNADHDCFVMRCAGLGRELARAQAVAATADAALARIASLAGAMSMTELPDGGTPRVTKRQMIEAFSAIYRKALAPTPAAEASPTEGATDE